MDIDRKNILAALRYETQELLQSVQLLGHSVVEIDFHIESTSNVPQITMRLLRIIENGLVHGISRLNRNDPVDPWPVIIAISSKNHNLLAAVNSFDEIKSGLGKTRLWICSALMQKQLGHLVQVIIDNKANKNVPSTSTSLFDSTNSETHLSLMDIYAKDSLLISADGQTFVDLIERLSVVDFSFILKDNLSFLDGPLYPIDYMSCIRIHAPDNGVKTGPTGSDSSQLHSQVIEQKKYLEETLNSTQSRLIELQKKYQQLMSENSVLKSSKSDLEQTVLKLQNDNKNLTGLLIHQTKETKNEIEVARETFRHSSVSMDAQIADLEKRLAEEKKLRRVAEEALSSERELKASLESELEKCKTVISERNASLTEHQDHISQLVSLNREFSEKLKGVTSELEASKARATELQEKADGMTAILASMNERCHRLKQEKAANEKALKEAIDRASRADKLCVQLRADLDANKELSQTMQSQLDEAFNDLTSVKALQENLDRKSESLRERDAEIERLRTRCAEADRTLAEMAQVVAGARVAAERADERLRALSAARWAADGEAPACVLCGSPFSFARRRHHCRNCGLIFCQDCSAYRMSLPSSAKPVRVCETCHNELMQRYAAR